jgi:glycosyltransferase involved in cell wall biosynthesis
MDRLTTWPARWHASVGDSIACVKRANGGPAAARNTGVEHARGDYLAFLDADDVWHPQKLQRQLSRFEARPELGLSLCYQRVFWVESMRAEEERLRREKHPFVEDHVAFVCQAMLMPRTTFDRVGPFDEKMRIGEDTEWVGRAQSLGVVREVLKEVLFSRRLHENNLSYSRFSTEGARDRLRLAVARIQQRRQNGA